MMIKSMFIFILLFCIRIREIDCGEEVNVSTSKLSNEISPAQHIDTSNPSPEDPSTEPADPPTQPIALRLIKRRKKSGFEWPVTPDSAHLHRGDTIVNLCPAESAEEHVITAVSNFQYCLFVKKESKKTGTLECEKEPEPKLWSVQIGQDRCGEHGKGALYTYVYQVCWKSNYILRKLSSLDWKFIDKHFPKIRQEFVEVYTVCLHYQKDILYLKYTLVPVTEQQKQQALKHRELQTKMEGSAQLDLDKNVELFNKKEQMKSLQAFFGENFDEYLVPEMLISPTHITPSLSKNSLHNYLNVAPQWSSMKNKWQQLENHIWSLGIRSTRTETIFIYAGIQGKITKDGEQLNVKIDSSSFSVPSVWWKLILNRDYEEGIVIAMQNEPEKISNLGAKLCHDSVCNSYGWEEISEIAYCCIYDENMQKLLNLHKEKLTINGVFNPKIESSSRPPKPEPKKPESEKNKWLKKILRRKPKSTNEDDDDE